MIKTKSLIYLVAVLVVVALGVWAGVVIVRGNQGTSDYSAVYLATGDIYFGTLSWLPVPHLTNVWVMQRGVDAQNQPQFGVAPFTGAVWGPTDRINLNPKEIIFWTRLRSDSQIAQAIENPASAQTAGSNLGTSPQTQGPADLPQGNTVQPKKPQQ